MGGFFKGWRGKSGCITLVMAIASFGLWVAFEINIKDDADPAILITIIGPLGLLSAYLLFSKPRVAKPKETSEK